MEMIIVFDFRIVNMMPRYGRDMKLVEAKVSCVYEFSFYSSFEYKLV